MLGLQSGTTRHGWGSCLFNLSLVSKPGPLFTTLISGVQTVGEAEIIVFQNDPYSPNSSRIVSGGSSHWLPECAFWNIWVFKVIQELGQSLVRFRRWTTKRGRKQILLLHRLGQQTVSANWTITSWTKCGLCLIESFLCVDPSCALGETPRYCLLWGNWGKH